MSSKNDFNNAIILIEDIRANTNNVKSSSGDKKVFNDLDKLITDIKNKKTTKENSIKKIKNIASDLDQQRQNESTVFQNKMIDVVYYLFNSLEISSQPGRLILAKWAKASKKRFNKILRTITKAKNEGLKISVDGREVTLDNTERLLKNLGNRVLDRHEFKREYNNNDDDVEVIVNKPIIIRIQEKWLKLCCC